MSVNVEAKDPDAVLDYVFDWSDWMGPSETISSHEFIVDNLTVESSSNDDTTVTARLSGGTANTSEDVTCRVTTSTGQINDRTLSIRIRER